jgi:hypothetical protein
LFSGLGPIAIFSAKHHWTAPRLVRLRKREHEGFGFSVRGDSPVIIAGVDANSIAEVAMHTPSTWPAYRNHTPRSRIVLLLRRDKSKKLSAVALPHNRQANRLIFPPSGLVSCDGRVFCGYGLCQLLLYPPTGFGGKSTPF